MTDPETGSPGLTPDGAGPPVPPTPGSRVPDVPPGSGQARPAEDPAPFTPELPEPPADTSAGPPDVITEVLGDDGPR
ncbi:MAG: hypothetical protein M3Z75_30280 [Actinomycetota bacterium]|nr:hypothetical protein [Actinomycetota bacterium]